MFNENIEPFVGPKPLEMSHYEYFSRSSRSEIISARARWNSVVEKCTLSAVTLGDIKQRFQSKDPIQHLGAFFELFVFDFFASKSIRIEEGVKANGRKPDFIVTMNDNFSFCLEATCSFQGEANSTEEYRKDQITNMITKIESDKLRVCIHIEESYGINVPKKLRTLKNEIETWLRTIEDRYSKTQYTSTTLLEDDVGFFLLEKFKIELTPILMYPQKSSKEFGLMLLGSGSCFRDNFSDKLKSKIFEKRDQVKSSSFYNVVTVNMIGLTSTNKEDVAEAIFGEFGNSDWSKGGFWFQTNGKSINTEVHAIMLFHNVDLLTTIVTQPWFILNPFDTSKQFPMNLPFLRYCKPSLDNSMPRLIFLDEKK